jgi:hypothetical protein
MNQILLLVSLLAPTQAEVSLPDSYVVARQKADARGCPLVVVISAPWCPACQQMHREEAASPITTCATAIVDWDRDRAFAQKLFGDQPVSLPHAIVWDDPDKPGSHHGYLQHAELVKLIEDAIEENEAGELGRSPQWPALEKRFKHDHPACACCGEATQVIHHVVPFHVDPSKELDPTNLIAVCNRCHLLICHLGNFRSWNVNVRSDAARLLAEIKSRPMLGGKQ